MIAILDYGMGNLHSVQKAIERVGGQAIVTTEAEALEEARGIILPGVGAFGDAMEALQARRLAAPLQRQIEAGKPLLGICLGMQLLFEESEEMGRHRGLGVFGGRVVRFPSSLPETESLRTAALPSAGSGRRLPAGPAGAATPGRPYVDPTRPAGGEAPLRVPHVGWNRILSCRDTLLLEGIGRGSYAYFVHSYYVLPNDEGLVLATTDYGAPFASVVGRGNLFGVQFHPEKSQQVGLRILQNFFEITGGGRDDCPASN